MAQRHPDPTDTTAGPVPADALAGYLRAQATEFLRALRLHRESGGGNGHGNGTVESADAARALRHSARRISGSLHTFRPLLDESWSEDLRPELAWLSGTLAREHACQARLDRLLLALHRLSGTPAPPGLPAQAPGHWGANGRGGAGSPGAERGNPGPGWGDPGAGRAGAGSGRANPGTGQGGSGADHGNSGRGQANPGPEPGNAGPARGGSGGDRGSAGSAPGRGGLGLGRDDYVLDYGNSARGQGGPGPDRAGPTADRGAPAAAPARGSLAAGAVKAGALLDRQLTLARTRAHSTALQALGSSRFHAVADKVAVLASDVPLAPAAAGADLRALAAAAEERLTDAVAALPLVTAGSPYNAAALVHGLSPDPAPHPQDAPWHQVRLLLRLHRYAREVLHGGPAAVDVRLLAAGRALNRHRDAAEAAAAAASAARTPRIAPATAYALGVLHADQRHEVEAARYAFQRSWQTQAVGAN
ncbi:CHAD domain-containing protein [Streptomyces naganishii]|uniref:CHAD domain-containing protein n=1 Tax=Streptomyces naganishii JCM 4654 TaxID=1306179 RepID=A0A918YBF8_9ACTN|nr:CHAD domain-containing protein [Streptomyces naganishii]GHD96732.1 hypothetical protein GCM10010508_66660 [Streptomyces naganishii JCM 4654]